MATIDTSKLNSEITSKYSVVNNALKLDNIKNAELDTYKNEPKDEINVIVGDDKQPGKVYPQVKLQRWSNEVNFSVRLIDNEKGEEIVTTKDDKVIWEKGNIKIENYDYTEDDGGYKFVWYLKEKPKSNKIEFTIQSKGLNFFYQPPLTEEYQNGYSKEFQKDIVVTETQVKDLDGNVLVKRPENVVSSYAVYHSTKGGMVDSYGKDYKVGKAFHIYRPHIIDANGAETWGILHIENGIYSVEIPQEFLDKAVYPIKSNDTFGYTETGDSNWGSLFVSGQIKGTKFTTTGAGTITKITSHVRADAGAFNLGSAIYNSDLTLLASDSGNTAVSATGWKDVSVSSSISASTVYWLLETSDGKGCTHSYDKTNTTANQGLSKTVTFDTWPTITSPTYSTRYFSIYATYTPSGGGATANPHHLSSTGVGS